MKGFICFILLVISFTCFAQKDEVHYQQFPISPIYGTKLLQNVYFNGQLNSLKNYQFNNSISFVGLSFGGYSINYGLIKQYRPTLYYGQIIPQKVNINDTVSANLSGFQVGIPLVSYGLIKRNPNFKLVLALGFNTGRIKLSGNEFVSQKNAFFSPKIELKPHFRISRFFLSFIFEYEYDISKSAWKKLGSGPSEQINLNALSSTGVSAFVNIGYLLKRRTDKEKKMLKNKRKKRRQNK